MADTPQMPALPAMHRNFNGMSWPVPGKGLNELEWAARYASSLTMSERLVAASVMSAFTELIRLPQRRRNKVIAELRKGPATTAQLRALAAEIQPPQKEGQQ